MADQTLPYTRAPNLPLFENPPVTQVSMGLQLQGARIRAVELGALHERFAAEYPVVEEYPPAPIQIEQFGRLHLPSVEFQFLNRPPLPMLIFLAEDRASLVQVQDGAFYCAWRRHSDDTPYPRYETFRHTFIHNLGVFADFVGLPEIRATQAEIGYMNEIPAGAKGRPDILASRIPSVTDAHMREMISEISSVSISQRLTFKNQDGTEYARLHIGAEPALVDKEDVLRLSLVYRGEPHERFDDELGVAAIMRFLDEGHDRIVAAFAANTTPEAQQLWGRAQ